ncbi:MAG TPA: response regulator transcription factor [Terriglobales bacterium]|nr:response regulator transcription factor [Terriglobales bacterium]
MGLLHGNYMESRIVLVIDRDTIGLRNTSRSAVPEYPHSSRQQLMVGQKAPCRKGTVMTRILIADDSQTVRAGIRNLLNQHRDWEVCGEAIDGQDAIQKSRQLVPDVIVLDFCMPGVNGIEAARRISEICPSASMLLCSMFLDSQLVRLARKAGMAGAISKSNVGKIVSGIEALLHGEEFFTNQI